MYMGVSVCKYFAQRPQSTEEGTSSHGDGITGGKEMPDIGAGNQSWDTLEKADTLNF